jgi:hypothetical protein
MKTSTIAIIALGALALSKGVNGTATTGYTAGVITPTLTPQQSVVIGQQTLPLNSWLNDQANLAQSQQQYNFWLDQQKNVASVQFNAVKQSGFTTISKGFADLAASLGIKIQ